MVVKAGKKPLQLFREGEFLPHSRERGPEGERKMDYSVIEGTFTLLKRLSQKGTECH